MKDIKKFSILAVLFIFCGLNTVFSSSSVLVVTRKSDTGNDPCKRSDCLSLDGLESFSDQQSSSSSATLLDLAIAGSTDLIEIKININQDTPNGNFSFPWHIKVFSVDGRDLGKSKEFGIEAFNTHIEYAGLRSAKIDADLFSQIINKS
ncbi:MAG: hypothetical protein KTR30_25710, partial [Saprospiraceae bacterium]|nr:hypothetical protein [Saprospiraceae bacterium]